MSLKRLLYMSEHPPGQSGGAPIIARQHLRRYDPTRLHILCDGRLHASARRAGESALLPCRHTTVANLEPIILRPRRIFERLFDIINLARIPLIKRKAREIIAREGIEAIFTVPWRTDFALAAYQISQETGLPLYVFEMDDWAAMNRGPVVRTITDRWHEPLLSHASRLWVISPAMAASYQERFGVHGEFLFHFVDPGRYRDAIPSEPTDPNKLRLVYTGAVNMMFLGAFEALAQWLNEGMTLHGRRVTLDIWSESCPASLCGDAVRWRGFVPSDEVPAILAGADALVIAITFSTEPALRDLVSSSLYTKTVDYLASGKPVIILSPPGTAELAYAGTVTWPVTTLNRGAFERTLYDAIYSPETRRRTEAGLALINRHHTAETMGDRFLDPFRTQEICGLPNGVSQAVL